MAGIQYQRNKDVVQDLQPRLYYNTSENQMKTDEDVNNRVGEDLVQVQFHSHSKQHDGQTQCLNGYNVNIESGRHMNDQSTDAIGTLTLTNPPMVYALHRVVTTAQIQSTICTPFSSSSKMALGGAFQKENDCFLSNGSPCVNIKKCEHNGMVVPNTDSEVLMNSGVGPTKKAVMADQSCINGQSCRFKKPMNQEIETQSSRVTQRDLQNVIPTCVYLMSRVAVHMEIEGTTECPAQVMLAAALGCEELGIANKLLAQSIFGLWMTSSLLDLQLKSHHRPFSVRVAWHQLLEKYSNGNPIEKKFDEPMIMLKRNVFFSKKDEEKIKDNRIIELLYEEAKNNVLVGKYVMESVHCLMLGGIQARIELGPYNSHMHTVKFFRENQSRFLPPSVAKSSGWSWLPVSRKNSAEVKLLEQFKRVPQTATTRKLMRKYLEFCWALPFYGSAFFQGQVEQPVRGLMSLVNHKDVEVIIAVNERGVFVIDPCASTLLLGLNYEDFSWDLGKPSNCNDEECQTCIFIQFDSVENGMQFSKLIQIFSKQAPLMDALISHFADQMLKRKQDVDAYSRYPEEPNPIQKSGNGVLCNKLSRLTLATFDEDGRCIGQMGSLAISY